MKRKLSTTIIMYIVLFAFLIVWLIPIAIAIMKSLNINGFGNYLWVITNPDINYGRAVFNSAFISIVTAAIVVLLTSLAGYAFSKMKFVGSNLLYFMLLSCLAVPGAAVMMPEFFTMKTFGLTNTYTGLIIPMVAFNALQMLLLWRNYMDGLPNEIIEAARVDGCSTFRIYWGILMPLSLPMIATTGVLTFVYSWNDYLTPLLMLRDKNLYPITLVATSFMDGRNHTEEMMAEMYAALILMMIPSVIVYLISQKWLQEGMMSGSVKS